MGSYVEAFIERVAGQSQPSGLLDALEHLEAVANVPPKQRYTDAGELANTIASDAYESGIPQIALGRLLKVLTTKNNLDQGTVTALIKNLYPQERVISKHVTQVVCCLGPSKSKPSPATQALLVRWLILAYDLLEDKTHLGKLRKHVKPFRIQALMELIQNSGGDEKELLSLLRIFKNYYPEIIIGDVGGSRRNALFFKHPDPEWSSYAKLLQDQNMDSTQQSSHQVTHRGTVKRSKMEVVIPVLQTSRVSSKHTSLEEIRDVDHFVENIEKIELPNQIISTLGDAMAQKYLYLTRSETANHRLDEWLRSFLEDRLEQIREGDEDEPETLSYVLSFVEEYAAYTKLLLSSVRSFLRSYLQIWNGRDNRYQILRLLRYLPIEPLESLRGELLSPLESSMMNASPSSQGALVDLLDFYTSLITEWGVKLRNQPSISEESVSLSEVIKHAELLASSMLELAAIVDDNQDKARPMMLSVLEFYRSLANLFSHASQNAKIRLTVPPAPTVYTIVFTPSIATISILNSILAGYKSSFEASLTSKVIKPPKPSEPLYKAELVSQFNGYVMDMCNLVWRNRALNTEDPNALGCLIPQASVETFTNYIRNVKDASRHYDRESAFNTTLPSIFSLSHHPAFCNLSAACFADLEESQQIPEHRPKLRKPVTQKVLQALEQEGGARVSWQEYRVHMLDWLEAIGSRGTSNLMRSTMKALRKE
ncbi:hypothetical protein PENDEC_c006G04041 [Penicillium decumbens]|uniref:Mis6 domain protein n=1 Tax=Penicillium decumbens TaxID=69771 RepID=A0A1V6PGF5_PENDC|nr:hypothetical protein PENDEC_c006G04041 [Penicillium decumbens]